METVLPGSPRCLGPRSQTGQDRWSPTAVMASLWSVASNSSCSWPMISNPAISWRLVLLYWEAFSVRRRRRRFRSRRGTSAVLAVHYSVRPCPDADFVVGAASGDAEFSFRDRVCRGDRRVGSCELVEESDGDRWGDKGVSGADGPDGFDERGHRVGRARHLAVIFSGCSGGRCTLTVVSATRHEPRHEVEGIGHDP